MNASLYRVWIVIFTGLSLAAFASVGQQASTTTQDLLDRDVGEIDFDNTMTSLAFSYALGQARVPGGVADVEGCTESPHKIPFMGAKLRDVLDAIVAADPINRWEVENDLVNLLPAEGPPAFLETHIEGFDSKDATNFNWAASLLLQLPEVQRAEAKLGLSNPNHVQLGLGLARKHGAPNPKPESRLSVHVQDTTLREALNSIVRARGRGVWMYHEWRCKESSGYTITFAE